MTKSYSKNSRAFRIIANLSREFISSKVLRENFMAIWRDTQQVFDTINIYLWSSLFVNWEQDIHPPVMYHFSVIFPGVSSVQRLGNAGHELEGTKLSLSAHDSTS